MRNHPDLLVASQPVVDLPQTSLTAATATNYTEPPHGYSRPLGSSRCSVPLPELAVILTAAYLRLLAAKARKSPELAHMGPPDSAESRCYEPPRE